MKSLSRNELIAVGILAVGAGWVLGVLSLWAAFWFFLTQLS